MLENQNQIFGSKLTRAVNPRLKVILGGFLLVGVFASLLAFSSGKESSTELLKSSVTGTTPVITSVSPTDGEIGSSVYITGKNFSEVATQNLVKFGDATATVKAVGYAGDDIMRIVAVVPNLTPNQSYDITVKNQNGTAISDAQFEVSASEVAIPSITRFTPTSGYAGDKIYIYGDNLAANAEENKIELDTENGNGIIVNHPEFVHIEGNLALKFAIPEGAITGKIHLTVNGVAAESVTNLEVLIQAPENPVVETPAAEVIPSDTISENPTDTTTPAVETTSLITETPATTPEAPITTSVDTGNIPQNLQETSDATGWRLTWEKPSLEAAYTYNVYYSTRSGSYLHRFSVDSVTTTPLGNNFSANQHYYLVVTAVDTDGNESNPSNEVSFVFNGIRNTTVAAFTPMETPTVAEMHAAADTPIVTVEAPKLSEEGPAETLLISGILAALFSGWFFRRKIWAK
ncbi:MAG: IPT/TIG domain-containing protein [Candidatus Gracilibacteria bacterium]|nr:IPT/TIG domain-containing protein [Candidatus Gracilibacteria bacterium]MDD5178941.1 IPT/TIG domain-containing protein [Candidatus Gracilibacteria bacterium]